MCVGTLSEKPTVAFNKAMFPCIVYCFQYIGNDFGFKNYLYLLFFSANTFYFDHSLRLEV